MRALSLILTVFLLGSAQAAPPTPPEVLVEEPIVRQIEADFTWEMLESGAWKAQDTQTVTMKTGTWWSWDASPKPSPTRQMNFIVAALWSERHPDKILVRATQSVDGRGGKSLPLAFNVTLTKEDEHVWGLTDAGGTVGQRLRVTFKETTPPPQPIKVLKTP